MSLVQKVLLILSCIFYALTLFLGLRYGAYVALSFFMLHSLTLVLFAYRVFKEERDDSAMTGTYKQDIGQELAAKDKEIEEIKAEMLKKEDQIIDFSREKETLFMENEELKKNLERVEAEKEELDARILEMGNKEPEKDMSAALLPPITEGLESTTVDIIAIAKQAAEELSENAKSASLKISVQSSLETLPVKADPGRLVILFRNIIDNSIKYMKKAGALIITISTINDDIFIVLKDTGEGLNEDETRHIFELNYQGSNRLSGNGLGLTQAKAIVECYGGTIYAKSTEGKGMGIYIQLPA